MVLPLLKLGTLALKTLSKPVANRIKKEAGLHPKFRNFIVGIAQLAKTESKVFPNLDAAGCLTWGIGMSFDDGMKAWVVEFGEHGLFCKINANHRITTTMQRRLYGHATDVGIRPLDEEKAVHAAVDLMGDVFVFSVAVAALFFEVQRSSRSEAKKEEFRKQEIEGMRQRDEELRKEVELLKQKLAEIERLAASRGFAGAFSFRHAQTEETKSIPAAA